MEGEGVGIGMAFERFMQRFTAEERGEIETYAQMLIADAMPLRDLRQGARPDEGSVGAETEEAASYRVADGAVVRHPDLDA
jgi:hypothetical protein